MNPKKAKKQIKDLRKALDLCANLEAASDSICAEIERLRVWLVLAEKNSGQTPPEKRTT